MIMQPDIPNTSLNGHPWISVEQIHIFVLLVKNLIHVLLNYPEFVQTNWAVRCVLQEFFVIYSKGGIVCE